MRRKTSLLPANPLQWLILILSALFVTVAVVPSHLWVSLWKAVQARLFWVLMLAFFCILALSFVWTSWESADIRLFQLFNGKGGRPGWLDLSMLVVTQLGNGLFAYLAAFIFYMHSQKLFSYELAVGNIFLWLIVEILKLFFHRKRPYNALTQIRIVGIRERGASFPSGHTSQAFFMASLVSNYFILGQGIKISFYLIALCVGITRMYVGMHFPRDILGGAVLGTSWGMLCMILIGNWHL
ncbi:phosphatase PAP2 family protein [Caproiciproducens sp. NJN-50]|uniref:phosphatase PAP2 family protein n=2 Tax=Acutalibacteraceae TaxID=3082771 RepID=UPI0013E8BA69|nr:phosphatase PAP2 family protein [Caproiciproducens sp. NJN-50]